MKSFSNFSKFWDGTGRDGTGPGTGRPNSSLDFFCQTDSTEKHNGFRERLEATHFDSDNISPKTNWTVCYYLFITVTIIFSSSNVYRGKVHLTLDTLPFT